jgi:TRAP-type C4-dicarboxylate transport system permease small subunit
MTEIGISVAVFCFLPYCQLTGANVTADIFTSSASPRWVAIFSLVASVVALVFSLLLLWHMYAGLLDQKKYGYITAILEFPHWVAFIPILISLALLAVASIAFASPAFAGWKATTIEIPLNSFHLSVKRVVLHSAVDWK